MIKVIRLEDKFKLFADRWSPKIVGRVDDHDVKIVKVEGEFVRHDHKGEDELFFVLKGRFDLELDDGTVSVGPGEMAIVPRGVAHRPSAQEETWLLVFEASKTKHTGDVTTERTLTRFEEI